ncbi:MAG: hypothetical protein M3Q81_02330 [bacterium]|nr:hypothetical protein [bacterium]
MNAATEFITKHTVARNTSLLGGAIGLAAGIPHYLSKEAVIVMSLSLLLSILSVAAFGIILGLTLGVLLSLLFMTGFAELDSALENTDGIDDNANVAGTADEHSAFIPGSHHLRFTR